MTLRNQLLKTAKHCLFGKHQARTQISPLKWEKWQIHVQLALLAKENITLDALLGTQPEEVHLILEKIYADTIQGSSAK